ncbi:High frequency lysogenization protein HflD [hydrothermal vent metagenome]|uniref:High frequency lysogenization protein HflD n=1 Tax=hydrothermal vent metagenome TaxID=652676 RepID=A0A3B0W679_9ZZZZ
MTEYTQQDRSLALVGIYQAAQLVHDLATTGKADDVAYRTCIQSLFCDNPAKTLDVYGGDLANIQVGVRSLMNQMNAESATDSRNLEITRYVLSLMILEKKLVKLGEPMQNVSKILEIAKNQQEHFGLEHDNVIASIARAYSENISQVNPRIIVNGQHGHLQNARTANKIRALLLAGIRSALLWDQVGGSRWGLIWSRKKYLADVQSFKIDLDDIDDNNNDDSSNQDNRSNKVTSLFKQD